MIDAAAEQNDELFGIQDIILELDHTDDDERWMPPKNHGAISEQR